MQFSRLPVREIPCTGHGMEWNGKWNGIKRKMEWNETEILVWIMEDARMEWKISRMEWKTIFHTSIPIPY